MHTIALPQPATPHAPKVVLELVDVDPEAMILTGYEVDETGARVTLSGRPRLHIVTVAA